jgi:CheY-like chemotaxis protein
VTLLGGTLGAQLAQFGSWHKPKFTGHWHRTGGILAHVRNSHVDATTLLGAARMAVRANCRKHMPKTSLVSVVDDDQHFRESMRRLMRSLGYAVEVFPSGADLLASPRLIETSCLIADVNMPAMTGLELYRHLIDAGYSIPTMLVTAYPNDADRARAMKDGVICYLRKPINEKHLIQCLGAALQSNELAPEN